MILPTLGLLAAAIFKLSAASIVFPDPDTPYQVTWESHELVDPDRLDPYNETHQRRLMISKFTPVPRAACLKTCQVTYMPEAAASILDDMSEWFVETVLNPTMGMDAQWPKGRFAQAEMEVCCETKKACRDRNSGEKFPTILLDPGYNTSRHSYSVMAQHIGGMGFEVIVMDHPYETGPTVYPDGTIVVGGVPDIADPTFALDVRAADASFVLDVLGMTDSKSVVYVGGSLGGAAAAVAMSADDRIAAGVNLDGPMAGSDLSKGAERPFLIWHATAYDAVGEPTRREFIESTRARGTWVEGLVLEGSSHYTFSDWSALADIGDMRGDAEFEAIYFGTIKGMRAMEILREYLADFANFGLGKEGEGLLEGPSEKFPEISFL